MKDPAVHPHFHDGSLFHHHSLFQGGDVRFHRHDAHLPAQRFWVTWRAHSRTDALRDVAGKSDFKPQPPDFDLFEVEGAVFLAQYAAKDGAVPCAGHHDRGKRKGFSGARVQHGARHGCDLGFGASLAGFWAHATGMAKDKSSPHVNARRRSGGEEVGIVNERRSSGANVQKPGQRRQVRLLSSRGARGLSHSPPHHACHGAQLQRQYRLQFVVDRFEQAFKFQNPTTPWRKSSPWRAPWRKTC